MRNIFLGRVQALAEPTRVTPFFEPHSTRMAGWKNIPMGDDRFIGNLFAESKGSSDYDAAEIPVRFQKNIYANGAKPAGADVDAIAVQAPGLMVELRDDAVLLQGIPARFNEVIEPVATADLGVTVISGSPYENPDGSELLIESI